MTAIKLYIINCHAITLNVFYKFLPLKTTATLHQVWIGNNEKGQYAIVSSAIVSQPTFYCP